ncbi:hypothetical protein [Halocola ammonii]
MKNFKSFLLEIPEFLLIGAVIFYWMSTAVVFNFIAIVLLLILALQIIFKFRILGLIIPGVLILASLYMLMAMASELREFPEFNADAQNLLFVGLSYFLGTIAVSGLMIYKYVKLIDRKENPLRTDY